MTPGDANDNGRVDHLDLLNLGLLYRQAGPDRRLGLTGPAEEYGVLWPGSTPRTRTNLRYVDCNGDGVIDREDAPVIGDNWSESPEPWQWPNAATEHSFDGSREQVPLLVQADSIVPGQINEVSIILGTETEAAATAYGLAFSLEYDSEAIDPGSVELTLSEGWLTSGSENVLQLQRNDTDRHRMEMAMTHTDGIDRTGSGRIATLRFMAREELEPGNLIEFRFGGALLIDHLENETPLRTPVVSITTASGATTSIPKNPLAARVQLYPVPARERLYLRTTRLDIQRLQLLDVNGSVIGEWGPVSDLQIGHLAPAVYFLRLHTSAGPVVKRWVKH